VDPSRSVGVNANSSNFKVVIRTRPPLSRELNGEKPFQNIVLVDRVGGPSHTQPPLAT
jgi:hypothetical protein